MGVYQRQVLVLDVVGFAGVEHLAIDQSDVKVLFQVGHHGEGAQDVGRSRLVLNARQRETNARFAGGGHHGDCTALNKGRNVRALAMQPNTARFTRALLSKIP